jgi:hypothetical protein
MSAIGSAALLSGAVFLGAFVSRLAGFAVRYLRHTRLRMEAIAANLWALRKDIQTEDEHRRISELAMILYRHSE